MFNDNLNQKDTCKNLEILAPAGSAEALKAAVFAGANAVYIGGSLYSARANATNFTNEDIEWAAKFCRVRDVKLYVAVNTLIKNNEIDEVLQFIKFLCEISVSAIIVQDMGLLSLIREVAPDLEIHISTQAAVQSPSAMKILEKVGAKRVVLARELSINEIKEIRNASDLELEVFVHGALCMCLSGRCYFSALLGSRSGNRGKCAQPCRLPFSAKNTGEYSLSLKDLSFIEDVKKLSDAGVKSLKIEGRMKRAEYVAAATLATDYAVKGEKIPEDLKENLKNAFSRSGFTKGYLQGEIGKEMFGIRTKEDVISANSKVYSDLKLIYKDERRRVALDMEFSCKENDYPHITVYDDKKNFVKISGKNKAQTAINVALSEENLKARLSKLGGTPYFINEFKAKIDENLSLSVSDINGMRREAIEKIEALREQSKQIEFRSAHRKKYENKQSQKMSFVGIFRTKKQMPKDLSFFSKVYLPISEPISDFLEIKSMGVDIGAYTPQTFFGKENVVKNLMKNLKNSGIDEFLCSDLSTIEICNSIGAKAQGAYSLNVTNDESLAFYKNLGLSSVELSFELNERELKSVSGDIDKALMVYGRQSLMTVRNCPLTNSEKPCKNAGDCDALTDRKNMQFPIVCKNYSDKKSSFRSIEILNSVPLSLSDRMNEVKNVNLAVMRFTVENAVEINEVIQAFINGKKLPFDYTRGLFYRGVL